MGAGASGLRNRTAAELLREVKFAAVRGNRSEIRTLAGLSAATRGVDAAESDSARDDRETADLVRQLSIRLGCTVAATGPVDTVSDGNRTLLIRNGHPMLSSVTGTGCMCSALIGCFCGASHDFLLAAAAGIAVMGIAGELAYEQAGSMGSGSFRIALIDAVSRMNTETFAGRLHIASL